MSSSRVLRPGPSVLTLACCAMAFCVRADEIGDAGGKDEHAVTHWAYRPLRKDPPHENPPHETSGALSKWTRSAIDGFVLNRLRERGLHPSPEADRRTLIRRLSFDLIGLAPSLEDVRAYLKDESPDAYEKLVDRLLASPRFGERQARRWMDLVHFAESHGHDQDRPRDHAWPYRDYLIAAFNADRSYDRFVEDQVAGDVLSPNDPDAIVATGFLAAGPWDESSLRDIRPDSTDRLAGQYLDRDDIVTTTMSTFVSSSVHCARCHDHKLDAITQNEYYALQAVFAGTDKANRAYDPDPQIAASRQELSRRLAMLKDDGPEARRELSCEATQQLVRSWRSEKPPIQWMVLHPQKLHSESGSSLTLLADGSVLAEGPRPEKDVYRFEVKTDLKTIRSIRLEVLRHESLPRGGPGRQDNGNLHLSEFVVWEKSPNQPARAIALRRAISDFDQGGWTIAHSIDGKPESAWGIYPQIGKDHVAIFELKDPLVLPKAAILAIELKQLHGGMHLIGRSRLSLSSSPPPTVIRELPSSLRDILAKPDIDWSENDTLNVARHVLLEELTRQIEALPPRQFVYCGTHQFRADGTFTPAATPRIIHFLQRGEIAQPGEEVSPGTISLLPDWSRLEPIDAEAGEGARRAALARWLSDRNNHLTWRSIVNRLWHYHFGRGIVTTLNDFGKLGAEPSHPELLDWLAVTLQGDGASLKSLHRRIVTSAAYRQSSAERTEAMRIDNDNKFVWRMPRRRLDAETIRDSVLAIAGTLDHRMGGPSSKQFIQKPGVHVTPRINYQNFDVDAPENYRRSVYRFIFRTLPDPFMEALDCPDSSLLSPARSESVTVIQALATWNDKTMIRQSQHLASRLQHEAGPDLMDCLRHALELILSRDGSTEELAELMRYAKTQGLANTCRVLLNLNEFIFVD